MLKSLFQRFSQASAVALGLGLAFAAQAQSTDVTYLLPAPPNLPAFAPWIIAQQKGYYAAQNLNMKFIAAKGGVDVANRSVRVTPCSVAPSVIRPSWYGPTAFRCATSRCWAPAASP